MLCSVITSSSSEYDRLQQLIEPYFKAFGVVDYTARPIHDLDVKNMLFHRLQSLKFRKFVSFNKWKYCLAIITAKITKDNKQLYKTYVLLFKIDIEDTPGLLPDTVKLIPQVDIDKFREFCDPPCFEPECRCSEILTRELCDIDSQILQYKSPHIDWNGLQILYDKSDYPMNPPTAKKINALAYFKIDSFAHDGQQCYYTGRCNNDSITIDLNSDDVCIDSFTHNIVNDTYLLSE